MFARPMVTLFSSGVPEPMRAGTGVLANFVPSTVAGDAAKTITVADLAGGMVLRTGPTAGRTDTTPTAALILAANPAMDIGDTFLIAYSNVSAQIITFAGGTDVTMGTKTTCAASSMAWLLFTKTSATTMTCTVL